MKKLAYTLAEVLITLTIVGVVAALSIPLVTTSSQNQRNAAALSVAIADWENAMAAMLSTEGVTDVLETSIWKELPEQLNGSSSDDVQKKFFAGISSYLEMVSYYKNLGSLYTENYPKHISGENASGYLKSEDAMCMISKKGIAYIIEVIDSKDGYTTGFHINEDHTDSEQVENTESAVLDAGGNLYNIAAVIYIDVNGKNKPNTFGRDIFAFYMGNDGILYPYGGIDESIFARGDNSMTWHSRCSDTNKVTGLECTARLIGNGFKVDY